MIRKEKNGIVYYEFENIASTELVNHCFSTRVGGVSKIPYHSMNLAYHMGDDKTNVNENFRLISHAVGFDYNQIMMTKQIHQKDVQILRKNDDVKEGVDGLITASIGPVLTTYYADCVPLLFVDPVKRVIANSHAGWRGTSLNIAGITMQKMVDVFGCNPKDILCGIGPCISMANFEVKNEVVDVFEQNLPQVMSHVKRKNGEKWNIDLVAINYQLLIESGLLDKNIEVANLCTYENSQHFFSHRRDKTARGNMVAMISLK